MRQVNIERQNAARLEDISRDHRARYMFASKLINPGDNVLDACCGVGYGSKILSNINGVRVTSFDSSETALMKARTYYQADNINYLLIDYKLFNTGPVFNKVVCLEAIEHVDEPEDLLRILHKSIISGGSLIISSPNQTIIPYSKQRFPFHTRHWTSGEFDKLLSDSGFLVKEWYSQRDKSAINLEPHPFGRTMLALARKI